MVDAASIPPSDDAAARVWVIDDDADVRAALIELFDSSGIDAVAYASAAQFLADFDPRRAGCVLTDLRMPGIHGEQLLARLAQLPSHPPVVLLTHYGDVPLAVRSMKAGAADFFEKPVDDNRLLARIQQLLEDEPARIAAMQAARAWREALASLTPREREVCEHTLLGKTVKQIAAEIHLSAKTVDHHRRRMMEKLGAETVGELIRKAEGHR